MRSRVVVVVVIVPVALHLSFSLSRSCCFGVREGETFSFVSFVNNREKEEGGAMTTTIFLCSTRVFSGQRRVPIVWQGNNKPEISTELISLIYPT